MLAAVALIVALAVALQAQSSSSLTLNIASRLPAGADYATDVLGDAWDMCNAQDISIDVDELKGWGSDFTFYPKTATRPCLVGGTTVPNQNTGAADTNLSLLYRGFEDIINPGRSGLRPAGILVKFDACPGRVGSRRTRNLRP